MINILLFYVQRADFIRRDAVAYLWRFRNDVYPFAADTHAVLVQIEAAHEKTT